MQCLTKGLRLFALLQYVDKTVWYLLYSYAFQMAALQSQSG